MDLMATLEPSHPEAHMGGDLEQLEAGGAAGGRRRTRCQPARCGVGIDQHLGIEANHRRDCWRARVADKVRSTNRWRCCSLPRCFERGHDEAGLGFAPGLNSALPTTRQLQLSRVVTASP